MLTSEVLTKYFVINSFKKITDLKLSIHAKCLSTVKNEIIHKS